MDSEVFNDNPLVTVVTISYNSSAYIRNAIESVLAQSYTNIEYIIGDDCSTDDTWQIIREYKDSRIMAYRNESNLQEYANRNKAIGKTNGKYLIFIDGDDIIYPHGLDFMVRMLDAFPNSAMAIMRQYHPKLIYPVELSPRELYIAEYFDKSFLDTAFTNTFFRTEVLKKYGGISEKFVSGDVHIRLKIANDHYCLLINDNFTWWRKTPGQASEKTKGLKGILQGFILKKEMLDFSYPLTENEKNKAIENLQKKIVAIAIKSLLKGKFYFSLKLLSDTNLLKLKIILILLFKKEIRKDPFPEYSSVNPKRLHWSLHPYSRLPKI